jgi:hypothetical protein
MKISKVKDHIVREMMEDAFYAQVDPRRRQERKDADMIHEDKKAMANMPPEKKMHTYNQNFYKHACMKAGDPAEVDDIWRP